MWCDFKDKIKKEIYWAVVPTQNSVQTAGVKMGPSTPTRRGVPVKPSAPEQRAVLCAM